MLECSWWEGHHIFNDQHSSEKPWLNISSGSIVKSVHFNYDPQCNQNTDDSSIQDSLGIFRAATISEVQVLNQELEENRDRNLHNVGHDLNETVPVATPVSPFHGKGKDW